MADPNDDRAKQWIADATRQSPAASRILCGALGAYLDGRPDAAEWLASVARALVSDRADRKT